MEASPSGLTVTEIAQGEETGIRFFLPMEQENPNDTVWSIARILLDNIGEQLTALPRAIIEANIENGMVALPSHGLNSRPVAPTGTA
jgi:hypothetical protein